MLFDVRIICCSMLHLASHIEQGGATIGLMLHRASHIEQGGATIGLMLHRASHIAQGGATIGLMLHRASHTEQGGATIGLIYLCETWWRLDHRPPVCSLYDLYDLVNL